LEDSTQSVCFFCEKDEENIHKAATFALDARVQSAAIELQDRKLLAKLAPGDMHAIDAVYHAPCLTALFVKLNHHLKQMKMCIFHLKQSLWLNLRHL
jgi:hypothetical protein